MSDENEDETKEVRSLEQLRASFKRAKANLQREFGVAKQAGIPHLDSIDFIAEEMNRAFYSELPEGDFKEFRDSKRKLGKLLGKTLPKYLQNEHAQGLLLQTLLGLIEDSENAIQAMPEKEHLILWMLYHRGLLAKYDYAD